MLFGVVLSLLAEGCLTWTYHDFFGICPLDNIDSMVLRFLNTGPPPFEELAEKLLDSAEVFSSFTKERATGAC
jgi:hypothetical protein